jgi:hypothetical protein
MGTYTDSDRESIVTSICDKVIEDKISFNQAVKDSDISLVSFYKWISKNDDLQTLYKYARDVRSDVLFEEIIEIADTTEEGTVVETDDHGRTKEKTGDMTQHRRLKIDARKWAVSKMSPKKYGDKLEIEQTNKGVIQYQNVSKQFPKK